MGSVQKEGGGRGKNGNLSGQHIARTSRRVKKTIYRIERGAGGDEQGGSVLCSEEGE